MEHECSWAPDPVQLTMPHRLHHRRRRRRRRQILFNANFALQNVGILTVASTVVAVAVAVAVALTLVAVGDASTDATCCPIVGYPFRNSLSIGSSRVVVWAFHSACISLATLTLTSCWLLSARRQLSVSPALPLASWHLHHLACFSCKISFA